MIKCSRRCSRSNPANIDLAHRIFGYRPPTIAVLVLNSYHCIPMERRTYINFTLVSEHAQFSIVVQLMSLFPQAGFRSIMDLISFLPPATLRSNVYDACKIHVCSIPNGESRNIGGLTKARGLASSRRGMGCMDARACGLKLQLQMNWSFSSMSYFATSFYGD